MSPDLVRDTFDRPSANRFLATLPMSVRQSMAPYLRRILLQSGDLLHDPGQALYHVWFPEKGMVSLVAVMRNGASIETATLGPDSVVGANAGVGSRMAVGRAIVQLPGVALRIGAPQFRAVVLEHPSLAELLTRYNDSLMAKLQISVACNAVHPAEARICRWLLHSIDCVEGNTVPLTQEFLAQMLGVRRTTVNMMAQALQATGTIRYRRGSIAVLDRAALETRSCECYFETRRWSEQTFAASPLQSAQPSA
jgi:CRP-like cAMP-binding protein